MTSYNGTPDIMTVSGIFFEFLDPHPRQISIYDIAHSLSMLCRFGGHTKVFYSVAEHSVRVSHACNPDDALWGLLHDASETYLVDMPTPIKRTIPAYKKMENKILSAVSKKYGLQDEMPKSVKYADGVMLATEGRDLCADEWKYWDLPHKPLPETIRPWTQEEAKSRFMDRFHELVPE